MRVRTEQQQAAADQQYLNGLIPCFCALHERFMRINLAAELFKIEVANF